jgi:hypothetical protein
VVVLHVTIIAGGFLIGFLGSPAVALLLLLVLKSVIDVQAHVRQHARYKVTQPETVIPAMPDR